MINKTDRQLLEKRKIDKPLSRLRQRESMRINKITDKMVNIMADNTEIQKFIRLL